MNSSSTLNFERSPEPWTERGVKSLRDRVQSSSPIDNVSATNTSQVLSYEEFKGLGDSAQKQYFDDLSEDLGGWKSFKKSCPRIDREILQHYDKDNRLSLDEQEAADALQEDLTKKWNLSKEPSADPASGHKRSETSEKTHWYDNELRWNSIKSQFEFEFGRGPQLHYRYMPGGLDRALHQYGFFYHISSALLWYRLTILIGETKYVTTDDYKSSWDMEFCHIDGISTLRLWDCKGGARAEFDGLKKSQADALEFVNLLTRFKFPHTYDRVIAGTVA